MRWRRSVRYAAAGDGWPRTSTGAPVRAVSTRVCRARTASLAGLAAMVVRSCWHCRVGPAASGFPHTGLAPTRRRWEWRWSRNGRWQAGQCATRRLWWGGAGGDDEEPPRALPGAGVGEACRADLGAVGGCPAAGGDLPVGVSVGRVQAGEVEGGAVERGEGCGIHVLLVDAGESSESGDRLR